MLTYPLYIIAGTSGAGKTTSAYEVRELMGVGYNVYDMDHIVVRQDFQTACNNWIKIAYFNALSGNTTILFGAVPYPYDVRICDFIHHFDPPCYLLLHCDSNTRNKRLTDRGSWTPNGIKQTIAYAEKQYSEFTIANYPIIDTTNMAVSEVAQQIKQWVLSGGRVQS